MTPPGYGGPVGEQPLRVRKVLAYVVRGSELLVFRHRDHPIERTGLQVPAGTVRPDEPLDDAVLREALEETGLEGLRLVSYLGGTEYDVRPARPEVHERHVFHLAPPDDVPCTWTWHELHDGLKPPTAFEFLWLPLAHAHVLAAGMGALLHRLPEADGYGLAP